MFIRSHVRINGESYLSVETGKGKVVMLRPVQLARRFAIIIMS